jgi:hypothetical protein
MVTHEITRNISGLARALAQQGLMTEAVAETLQTQAQTAGVSFVEQVLATKRMSAASSRCSLARVRRALLDLAAFDVDQINRNTSTPRSPAPRCRCTGAATGCSSPPRTPANLQALEEVRSRPT